MHKADKATVPQLKPDRKTVPELSTAKKKIMEFLVTYGMQLLIVALFMFMVVVEVIVEVVRGHIEVVEVSPTIR